MLPSLMLFAQVSTNREFHSLRVGESVLKSPEFASDCL